MIRFRHGESWKREQGAPPVDSFGLLVDGIDLLSGVNEEPLERVTSGLLEAIEDLVLRGAPAAEVSLSEANLELSLARQEDQVRLSVVRLGPWATVGRQATVELDDLATSAVRAGKRLLADIQRRAPALLTGSHCREISRQVGLLESRPPTGALPLGRRTGSAFWGSTPGPLALSYRVEDPEDRFLWISSCRRAFVSSILCGGEIGVEAGGQRLLTLLGPPPLEAMNLVRAAGLLAEALDEGTPTLRFRLDDHQPPVNIDVAHGTVETASGTAAVGAEALAAAFCELALELVRGIGVHHPPQLRNPYLRNLAEQGQSTLASILVARDAGAARERRAVRGRAPSQIPLTRGRGRIQRVRFERQWQKHNLGAGTQGELLLGPNGLVFASHEMACGFSKRGALRFKHVASHGVGATADGFVVAATDARIMGFAAATPKEARWIRDHDGLPLGPTFIRAGGLLLGLSDGRVALAIEPVSGREVWRVAPPRADRCFLTLQRTRALVATTGGQLLGLDLASGQVRFRMRGATPFSGPAVPMGRKFVAALSRPGATLVFVADARTGAPTFDRELPYVLTAPIGVLGSRIFTLGSSGEGAILSCLDGRGQLLWERHLPVAQGPSRLLPTGRSIVVCLPTGECCRVGEAGDLEWRLAPAGQPIVRPLAPVMVRDVLMLPGERVRAVEPRAGRVLAEVQSGPGLCDLKLDSRLNLYLLDDAGTLDAFRLTTHLSVVG